MNVDMAIKLKQVCATCGSEDVVCDAYASWNMELQDWVLAQTYDKGAHCENCEGECRIKSVPAENI